jgi:uncharacterized protein YdhG (YjbR/CyaY superfamily)
MTSLTESPKNIDSCINGFPIELQEILNHIRQTAAPDAEECIIYGVPTFKLNENLG